jgi:RNA polymerase sigma-70 factor (ECF subfamily)
MRQHQDIDEKDVVEGCKKGISHFQYELFMRYSEVLLATCVRYVACEENAKDVLQESFLAIFKYIKSYNSEKGSLFTWMNRICINQSLKYIKSTYTVIDYGEIDNNSIIDGNPSAIELLEVNELFNEIVKLPEPYRTVFNLYEIEGFSHLEIANLLKIQEVSSRSILSRAKKLLIAHLQNLQFKEA